MTIGTIFGNSQKGGCEGCQNKNFGDCMICSRYDSNNPTYKDDNLLDGLNPCILHHNQWYSYSCEKENISENEITVGKTNFDYRQEICGNAPNPDNVNIQIRNFERESETPFYFGCNILTSEWFVMKMINTLTTKKVPGRKIIFVFHVVIPVYIFLK